MFNVGGAELVALVALALMVIGPQDLPRLTKKLIEFGKTVTATKSQIQRDVLTTLQFENPEKLPRKKRKPRVRKASEAEMQTAGRLIDTSHNDPDDGIVLNSA